MAAGAQPGADQQQLAEAQTQLEVGERLLADARAAAHQVSDDGDTALGTIVSESVDLTDRQAGLNTDARTIARLHSQLAKTTGAKQRAAIVARIQAIQDAMDKEPEGLAVLPDEDPRKLSDRLEA